MEHFLKAETIFFHHLIFNPKKRSCEFLINERHENCFPDILQRAKESLGIASPEVNVDLTSTAQQEDLHVVATSTKSFLGQVRSREIVEQIYKGEVCPRTLRNFSESPASSQSQPYSNGLQSGRRPDNVSNRMAELNGDHDDFGAHEGESNQDNPTKSTRREVYKPSPAMIAQQIENRKRSQAHERETSLHNLMNIYKATTVPRETAATTTTETQEWLTSKTRLADQKHSSADAIGKAGSTAPSNPVSAARLVSSNTVIVKTSKVTTTSMKDLIAKHSQSDPATTSPEVKASIFKVVPQSATESRKRPRPAAKQPAANSARKSRTLSSKTVASSGKKTLLDFFKQG
ncbi:unnamed protein product [Phytophthora lilii]|uniref:Unnamed protein product n=1 Tax=Phytophthora lilii TaxID=2077276 RepID=A0A9W6WJW0_9STRA|nr:unnamed protein product [Phytophthora lilii]